MAGTKQSTPLHVGYLHFDRGYCDNITLFENFFILIMLLKIDFSEWGKLVCWFACHLQLHIVSVRIGLYTTLAPLTLKPHFCLFVYVLNQHPINLHHAYRFNLIYRVAQNIFGK